MSEQDVIDEIGAELSAGNFEKALKLSQAAELEGHTSWYTKYSQGVCYRWLGHFEKAIDAYHASLALDPVDPMIVESALSIAFQQAGQLGPAALANDRIVKTLRQHLSYFSKSETLLSFENFEKYKQLSAALMSGGNTYSMMSNEHPTLEQYFLIKAMHSHFDALGVETDLTQTQFYMVCKQIDEDPEQNIDVSSEAFRQHWSIKLKYENLEYCQALLNSISSLLNLKELEEAKSYLQTAKAIMDSDHSKWDYLLHLEQRLIDETPH